MREVLFMLCCCITAYCGYVIYTKGVEFGKEQVDHLHKYIRQLKEQYNAERAHNANELAYYVAKSKKINPTTDDVKAIRASVRERYCTKNQIAEVIHAWEQIREQKINKGFF